MNTDTPKTDALDRELHNPRVLADRYSTMLDHARELEREVNAWRAAADGASGASNPEGLRNFIAACG